MQSRPITIWRVILVVSMAVFFIALGNHVIPFSGQKQFDYQFGQPSPYIGVWPGQGVSDIAIENDVQYRTLSKDSLYLDLKTPIGYRKVDLKIMVRNTGKTPPELGVRVPSSDWLYRRTVMHEVGQKDGWDVYEGALDLTGATRQNDKYTLLLHFPATPSDKESIQLSDFHVELTRDPLNLSRIWTKLTRH